jgi:predicted RNA-binding protein Jag
MKTIKNFFSRLFLRKATVKAQTQNHSVTSNDDYDLLKRTVHKTVADVFQKEPQNEHKKFSEKTDLPNNFDQKILEILNQYNKVFFDSFLIPKNKYKIKIDKKNIIVDVENKAFEQELSRSDKLSAAYEHIFQRIIHNVIKDFDYRLHLRSGQSAKKHHDYTVAFAKKMIAKVKQTGRKIVIPSKSNYERSIIHHVVEATTGVNSKSIGTSVNRNLIIYPDKNATHQSL